MIAMVSRLRTPQDGSGFLATEVEFGYAKGETDKRLPENGDLKVRTWVTPRTESRKELH
jgi:hypothetical protein